LALSHTFLRRIRRCHAEKPLLEEIGALYRGLVIGLVIAAPVGPVGLLCIRRTLQKGMLVGLATGLGAACADTLFGAISVLGVGAILDFIHHYEATIRIIGGLVVLFTAWHTWNDKPKHPQPIDIVKRFLNLTHENLLLGTVRAAFSGFVITLTNPLTLFGTLAVVATFGGINEGLESGVMIGGLFAGSALWWLMLSGGVGLVRNHCSDRRILMINRFTAACLGLLAVWAIVSGVRAYLV
jgi:threonine/homoserine/homoserine lactone efflux protein